MNIEQPGVGDPLFDNDVVIRRINGEYYGWVVGFEGCWVRCATQGAVFLALCHRAKEVNDRNAEKKKQGLLASKKTKAPGEDESVLDPLLGPKKKG